MSRALAVFLLTLMSLRTASAAPRQHAVSFGKWTVVKWLADDGSPTSELKVRPLLVDGRIRELTVGTLHEITDRAFAVQRVYRLNDSLPQEPGANRWRWELGSWLLVDRTTGKVQSLSLAAFDPASSAVSWFRDYAAYCGTAPESGKSFAVVVQVGVRKPLLKKALSELKSEDTGQVCSAPLWQRSPMRVTFDPPNGQKFTLTVTSRTVAMITEDESDE